MKIVQFLFAMIAFATLSSAWTVNFGFQPKGKGRVVRTYGGISSKYCNTFKKDERNTKMVKVNFDGETDKYPDSTTMGLYTDTECRKGYKELKVGKHALRGRDTQRFNSWQIIF